MDVSVPIRAGSDRIRTATGRRANLCGGGGAASVGAVSDSVGTNEPPLEPAPTALPGLEPEELDLDAVERDLDGVDAALGRLDDGTYWTDEVTGEEISDGALADDPTARRA